MSNSYRHCILEALNRNLAGHKDTLTIDVGCRNLAQVYETLTMVDVGCNIEKAVGERYYLDDFTETFQKLVKTEDNQIKVVAFEPVHYGRYEEKYGNDSNVTLIKKALASEAGTKKLYVPGHEHGLSSMFDRRHFRKIEAAGHSTKVLEVEATTIDEVFKDKTIIDYLKIDTEGSELDILRGAQNVLERNGIRFIQIEHGGCYQDAGITMDDVFDFLVSYDFSPIYLNATEWLWGHMGHQGF